MADNGNTSPGTGSPEDTGTDNEETETFDPDRAKAKIAKANSEAANLRRRVRELEAAEAKLKELEDADKTEGQRALEAAKAAEVRADKAEAELMRLTVAMEKGLTVAQAKRLVGTTLEELESDADELIAQFGISKDKDPAPKGDEGSGPRRPDRPRPANFTGPAGTDDDATFDAEKVAQAVRAKRNVL